MSDVNITGRIDIESAGATKSINEMNTAIKSARSAMNEAKVGSAEYLEANKKLKAGQEELTKSTAEGGGAFSILREKLGSTVPGFKMAEEGAVGFGKQLWELAKNPIILIIMAIVGALTLLYKAFTSTMAGAQQMEQIFTGMKAALTVLTDRLVTFGNAIIKLFTGDFKGAADDAKAAVTGIGAALKDSYGAAATIQKRLQEIRLEEIKDAKDQAGRKARLIELKEMLADEDISAKEKKKLAAELKDTATKDGVQDLARTKEKNDLEIKLIKQKKNLTEDDLNEINKLEIDNDNKLREVKSEGFKINRLNKTLDRQISADAKTALEAEKKAHEELIKKLEEEQILRDKIHMSMFSNGTITLQEIRTTEKKEQDARQAVIDKANEERLKKQKDFLGQHGNLLAGDIADNHAASLAKIQIAENELKAKQELQGLEISGLNALSDLVGRNTLVGKGLAIASATISTWLSASKAYASQISIPTPDAPIRAALAAGIAVATGLAQIKNIVAVQVPGQGGGGGSVSTSSINTPAPLSPQAMQTNTRLDAQSISGIGNAATGGSVRAFVVETDVSNNQQRIASLNRAARLG